MLIMSVLIAIILLLYIYRIFVFASIWFFFDRGGWVFVFLYIVFFFVILKVGICRDLVFLSYRGNFVGLSISILFRKGRRLKPPFHPFRAGIAALNTSKPPIFTICKVNCQNNDSLKNPPIGAGNH